MGLSDAATYAIEGLMGIFIFVIFFTAIAPSIIDTINNNSTVIGLPQATILIVSLLLLFFVLGIFMNMWKKITQPDQPQMGGY
jgi:membrane protein DedA with SNARE-associated domain